MKNTTVYIGLGIVVLALVVWLYANRDNGRSQGRSTSTPVATQSAVQASTPTPTATPDPPVTFGQAKKSAHYVSNEPKHAETLSTVPAEVKIKFNFDLAKPSAISITHNATEYGEGETHISSDKLTLTRGITSDAPNGLYTVSYTACWPDKSCHDGNFEFAIKR